MNADRTRRVFTTSERLSSGSRLTISSMALDGREYPTAAGARGPAKLVVNLSRSVGAMESPMRPIEITVNVTKNPGNHSVLSCSAEGTGGVDLDNICVVNMGDQGMRLIDSGTTHTYDLAQRLECVAMAKARAVVMEAVTNN